MFLFILICHYNQTNVYKEGIVGNTLRHIFRKKFSFYSEQHINSSVPNGCMLPAHAVSLLKKQMAVFSQRKFPVEDLLRELELQVTKGQPRKLKNLAL